MEDADVEMSATGDAGAGDAIPALEKRLPCDGPPVEVAFATFFAAPLFAIFDPFGAIGAKISVQVNVHLKLMQEQS